MEQPAPPKPIPSVITSPSHQKTWLIISALIIVILMAVSIIIIGKLVNKNSSPISKKLTDAKIIPATANNLPSDFNPRLQEGPYTCPTLPKYCQDPKYLNFGIRIKDPVNLPIVAAFDGDLITSPLRLNSTDPDPASSSANGNNNLLYINLVNRKIGLSASYYFYGSPPKINKISAGQTISTSQGLKMNLFGNNTFIFELTKIGIGQSLATKVNLSPKDFK